MEKEVVFSMTLVCYIKPENFTILRHIASIILKTREAQAHKNQSAIKYSPPNLLFGCARRNRSPYSCIL